MGDDRLYSLEDGVADAPCTEEDGEDLARHIEEERIDAEDPEEGGPATVTTDVDDGHQHGQQ